ncbi:MAG: DUF1080 domain-containing protein [Verrucomicrobia subdivision 3 bacterium]|nr:DUF1080 domain-containing protein [Limisphaerales bacterium]
MFRKPLICLFATALACRGAERLLDWRDARVNEPPPGFRSLLSGDGRPGEWKIVHDQAPSAFPLLASRTGTSRNVRPVVAQLSRDPTDNRNLMLVFDGEEFGDFTVTTQFKLVDGVQEQMAGIAFRIQDEKNYYYVRASGLGQNVNFFKWHGGQLIGPIGGKAEVAQGVWHELTVQCRGNEVRFSFNGKEVVPPLRDNSFSNGKIGLWTKSDSVSYFGDIRIDYTPREKYAQVLVRETIERYPRLLGLKICATPPESNETQIIASKEAEEVGRPAPKEAIDVIARGVIYHGEEKGRVLITMPLRDSNGDVIAAAKVIMKSFPGQTEKNALARALPIVKQIEARVSNLAELVQ